MQLIINIDLKNAAFDDPGPEVARILEKYADTVRSSSSTLDDFDQAFKDINGNTVGYACVIASIRMPALLSKSR